MSTSVSSSSAIGALPTYCMALERMLSPKAKQRMRDGFSLREKDTVRIHDDRNAFVREGTVMTNRLDHPTSPALIVLFKLPGRRDVLEYEATDFEYIAAVRVS